MNICPAEEICRFFEGIAWTKDTQTVSTTGHSFGHSLCCVETRNIFILHFVDLLGVETRNIASKIFRLLSIDGVSSTEYRWCYYVFQLRVWSDGAAGKIPLPSYGPLWTYQSYSLLCLWHSFGSQNFIFICFLFIFYYSFSYSFNYLFNYFLWCYYSRIYL